jgi:hypothetical protein
LQAENSRSRGWQKVSLSGEQAEPIVRFLGKTLIQHVVEVFHAPAATLQLLIMPFNSLCLGFFHAPSIGVIAGALGKSNESVRLKVKGSGLVEVEQANFQWSTSSNPRRRIFARADSSETPNFSAMTDSGFRFNKIFKCLFSTRQLLRQNQTGRSSSSPP